MLDTYSGFYKGHARAQLFLGRVGGDEGFRAQGL